MMTDNCIEHCKCYDHGEACCRCGHEVDVDIEPEGK